MSPRSGTDRSPLDELTDAGWKGNEPDGVGDTKTPYFVGGPVRSGDPRLSPGATRGMLVTVTGEPVELQLDDAGLSTGLPRPDHPQDVVGDVPFRPVLFRDDDLPAALERSAAWLRRAQEWLGEPLDVIAVHLDYDDRAGSPYYEVKLLCNDEDLAGAPLALREAGRAGG